ncbi:MAG TPA: hypothetical protein DEP53_18810 [Bacteroidetes bacterium]|nr:hypothetical protein [Bacteroidota bacterium]
MEPGVKRNSLSLNTLTFSKFKEEYLLVIAVLLSATTAAVLLYNNDRHVFLYFGDAASHIVKSRILVDSQHFTLESIGPVWLPLPHLLLLPLAAIDSLFFSGIAGLVLGIPCLIGTGLFLLSLVRRITGSRLIALLSACLFCLNPNVVYMALTPMGELPLIFLVAAGAYGLLRWTTDGGDTWLMVCAAAVMLASLCRYEAWILTPLVSIITANKGVTAWKQSDRRRAIRMLSIAALTLSGIILWICWNAYEFGDPFRFAPWNFRSGPFSVNNPKGYRQEAVPLTLLRAIVSIFGPMALLAAAAGIVRFRRLAPDRRHLLPFLFLALPAIFIFATILMDLVLIDQWWWNWRFVLIFGLFLSASAGVGLAEFFKGVRSKVARGAVAASLLAMPIVQLTVPSVGVATYEDAAKIFSGPDHVAASFGERLGSIHEGGRIVLFTGSYGAERIMVSSGIALKTFRSIPFPGGQDILLPIRSGDRYVVIGKKQLPDTREVVRYWLSRREMILQHYDIRFEDEYYLLLESKNANLIQ